MINREVVNSLLVTKVLSCGLPWCVNNEGGVFWDPPTATAAGTSSPIKARILASELLVFLEDEDMSITL